MKKGFTLIELLAVIAILAIIMVIATPKVLDVINESKYNAFKTNQDSVVRAAQLYISNSIDQLPENVGDTVEVSLNQIKTADYTSPIASPFNSNNCSGYVLITKTADDNYTYNPQLNCIDSTREDITSDGLVGYWKLDDKTGIIDISGNGHDGIPYGGIVIGSEGDATSFDGAGDYIDIGFDVTPKTTYTKSVWLKTNSQSAANFFSSESSEVFYAYAGDLILSNTWSSPQIRATVNFYDSKWHHIVATYDGTNGYIYFDGELQSSGALNDLPATVNEYFGSYGSSNWYLGYLKEIKVYNRALSADEIKVIYESNK